MGTQGIVTLTRGGRVVAKLVAGCGGYQAEPLAAAIRSAKEADPQRLRELSLANDFGCDECLIVQYRDVAGGSLRMIEPAEGDPGGLYSREDLFDRPAFNPRWRHGTADHAEVVDLPPDPETKT